VLSSMSTEGMGSSLTVEDATTSAVFEAYVEQVLAPTLRKRQVVVMDNLLRPTKAKGYASSSTCRPTLRISTL
jgi:transposase